MPIAFLCRRADEQNTSQIFLLAGDKPWSSVLPCGVTLALLPWWLGTAGRVFILYYWRWFHKLAFRLGYLAGSSKDLWGIITGPGSTTEVQSRKLGGGKGKGGR